MTTHSMAEADALADKIAIMSAGQIRAIGHSSELKARFGYGYIIKVQVYKQYKDDLDQILYQANPNIKIDNQQDIPGKNDQIIVKYILPSNNPISYVYDALEQQKGKFIVTFDIQFSSLEDVFLTISNMIEPLTEEEKQMMDL